MDKRIIKLSNEFIDLGMTMITASRMTGDKHALKVGNLLQLFGGIITDEADTEDLDKFLMFFSSKKIMETLNPAHILLAKRMAEMPRTQELVDALMKSLDGNLDCEDCPAKDQCTDRHCAKPKDSSKPEDEKKKKPTKRRTPRKPKE